MTKGPSEEVLATLGWYREFGVNSRSLSFVRGLTGALGTIWAVSHDVPELLAASETLKLVALNSNMIAP